MLRLFHAKRNPGVLLANSDFLIGHMKIFLLDISCYKLHIKETDLFFIFNQNEQE
jgi:hypothetical protein